MSQLSIGFDRYGNDIMIHPKATEMVGIDGEMKECGCFAKLIDIEEKLKEISRKQSAKPTGDNTYFDLILYVYSRQILYLYMNQIASKQHKYV